MKKILVCLFAAALMLLPMGAGAAMQSVGDSDLAALTGQAGVDISVTAPTIKLGLTSISWGDPDGFGTTYSSPGYLNVSVPQQILASIGIGALTLSIDVGTNTALKTVCQIGVSTSGITLDAFLAGIYLDSTSAVVTDYLYANGLGTKPYATWDLATPDATLNSKCLGVVGLSGLNVGLSTPVTLQISAH